MTDVWEWSDTCHAAYGLHLDEGYSARTIFYSLEAVDELSQLHGTICFLFVFLKKICMREIEHRRH